MKVLIAILATLAVTVRGQCPSGFVHHHSSCYTIPMYEGSWADGMMVCQELGGQLAEIETTSENIFFQGFLKSHGNGLPNDHDFWIGGGDFLQEGKWRWVMSDRPINQTFWAPGQPNNHNGPQGCLRVSEELHYLWEDGNCDSVEYPVCEVSSQSGVDVGK